MKRQERLSNSGIVNEGVQLRADLTSLMLASHTLLNRIDNITSHEFSKGGERHERESLRRIIETIRARQFPPIR